MNNRNHGGGTGAGRLSSGNGAGRKGSGSAGFSPAQGRTSPEEAGEEELPEDEQYLAGKHPVLEALKAGRALNKIWLSSQAQRHLVAPILEEAKARGVVVQYADKRRLDLMVPGLTHQGVVAQAAAVSYVEVEELLARAAERGEAPLLVLLDEVEDPHNLGSVLRTADCTGVHGVIIPKRRSASLTAVVAKTSAGAVEYVPVARVANLVQTMAKLKEAGVWIAGTDANAPSDVYRANLTGPLAIVIGSEGKGLSRLVREKCDFLLSHVRTHQFAQCLGRCRRHPVRGGPPAQSARRRGRRQFRRRDPCSVVKMFFSSTATI
jgi:23S rRNA (guanosine2251-2'-O)-methyltransferase